jgi:hypothetical protein
VINEIKENTNKHLNEFKENTNKQLNEIRKTTQDIKEKFNHEKDSEGWRHGSNDRVST